MGEIEAAGEIVTGALLGRAVEPHAGEGGGEGHICLNCGTALIGAHCHHCGQSAHVHRTLSGIGHELLHGVFHFEGKLWHTLPLLAWRPGQLTRRYIDGERARFVSPIAIFLFSIFALFATFSMVGLTPQGNFGAVPKTAAEVAELKRDLQSDRAELVAQLAQLPAQDARAAGIEARIAGLDKQIAAVRIGKIVSVRAVEGDVSINTGWARLDHGIEKAAHEPALALYKVQSNSYKFSWLLIPLSLPFVWLLFAWRREFHLYDHAVFVTYSIAFMSLLFIALTGLGAIGVSEGLLVLAAVLIVPIHVYSQLKDGYGLTRTGAMLRAIVLLLFAAMVLALFLAIILAMGLLG